MSGGLQSLTHQTHQRTAVTVSLKVAFLDQYSCNGNYISRKYKMLWWLYPTKQINNYLIELLYHKTTKQVAVGESCKNTLRFSICSHRLQGVVGIKYSSTTCATFGWGLWLLMWSCGGRSTKWIGSKSSDYLVSRQRFYFFTIPNNLWQCSHRLSNKTLLNR